MLARASKKRKRKEPENVIYEVEVPDACGASGSPPNERARASISIKINNLIKITTVKVSDLHVWVFCLSMQDNFIGY